MNLERIEHNFRDKVFEKLRISTEGESRSDQTLFRRVYDMTFEDRRLMEDYLPIRAISAEGSREKSIRKGHISTLHLWWGRRPLVACHAVVYGALVPADQFRPKNGPLKERNSLGRFLSPIQDGAMMEVHRQSGGFTPPAQLNVFDFLFNRGGILSPPAF